MEHTSKGIQQKRGAWSFLLVIGAFLLGKFKWVAGILKFAKLPTLISMLVSLWAYAAFYGWKFAIALIYQLFIHELGHLVAAKRKGIPTTSAIFIPFVGAVVGMKEMPKNAKDEAYVAYGGPLFGLFATLPAFLLYHFTESPFWGMVMYLGAFLNLFNLIPVSPLDGGRIVSALSPKVWFLGLLLLLGFVIFDPSFLLIYILFLGFLTWLGRFRDGFKQELIDTKLATYKRVKEELALYHTKLKEELNIFDEKNKLEDELKWLKKEKERTYISFIEDNEMKRQALHIVEYDFVREKLRLVDHYRAQFYSGEQETEANVEAAMNRLNKEMDKLYDEKKQIKTYYITDTKTKWTTLMCYLLLVGAFALIAYFGMGIMQQFDPSTL